MITRKPIIKALTEESISAYRSKGINALTKSLYSLVLTEKVKFPILEYSASLLYDEIPNHDQLLFCDQIEHLKTEGGNVLLGILLQKRLPNHFEESIQKATEYISKANAWYVCDIIGERVLGFSLLTQPVKTIAQFKRLMKHDSFWVLRSLGAGAHYAIKKGLPKQHCRTIFELLISMANSKNKEVKQGIGWAAKTTARFHPQIIELLQEEINDNEKVAKWFRTKIKIGLSRHQYAKGD